MHMEVQISYATMVVIINLINKIFKIGAYIVLTMRASYKIYARLLEHLYIDPLRLECHSGVVDVE